MRRPILVGVFGAAAQPPVLIPAIDLNGASAGIDASGIFYEAGGAVTPVSAALLTDPAGNGLGSLTMTCGGGWGDDGADESISFDTWTTASNANKNSTLVVGAVTFRLVYVASSGELTVTNNAAETFTAADGQALIRLFEYNNVATTPSQVSRTFTWVASDVPVEVVIPDPDIYEVRETGGSTTDTFTLSEVDDGTLATFVGANTGALATWYDDSGNDNHVVQTEAAQQPKIALSGVVQEGVVFQASDYMKRARITSGVVSQMSIAFWMKVPDAASARTFAAEMQGAQSWYFKIDSTGRLMLFRFNGASTSIVYSTTTDLDDNTWKHVVLVIDGANVKYYVNNVLITEEPSDIVSSSQSGATEFEVGADRVFANLNGTLSDFRLWQSALTLSEVGQVYAGNSVGSPLIWLKGNYTP